MKRWPTKPLGEVCVINPKLSVAEIPTADTDVTFVPMAAIDETTGQVARPELRKYRQVAKGYTPFQENDVLFAKITPCMENGKAAIAHGLRGGLGFGSTEFHVIRPTASLLPEWVFALIRQPSFREAAKANFTGTAGQQRVPADFLKSFPIPVPPLAEQERIVKLLDEADALRKLRAQADRRTAALIPALFHEMFGDKTNKHGQWTMERFGDLLAEPLRNGQSPAKDGRFIAKVFTLSAITGAEFLETAWKEAPFARKPEDDCQVSERFFLICRGNGNRELVGRGKFPARLMESIVFPDTMIAAVPKADRLLPEYLDAVWHLPATRGQIQTGARTTNGTFKINQTVVENISLPVPPIALQKQFAERVTEIRALEAAQATSRRRLDALFQSLLHRAFNDEL